MSKFTELLVVTPLPDGRKWVIMKDFSYAVGNEDSEEVIYVPIGFVTDFASVPRPLWWLYPKWGKYGNAAVIHDYLYWSQKYTKKKADLIFLEAMKVLGVNKITSFIMYKAVSWGGYFAWASNKKQRLKGYCKVLKVFPQKVTDWADLGIHLKVAT